MVRVCDGKALKGDPNAFYMLRTFGNSAHEIWNVNDPANPVLLSRIPSGQDTHKNWWECDTGIAYLVSGLPGWRTRRMTSIYDLSDPAKPVKIRDFGLAGQQPGATGTVPTELHGPISTGRAGNRVYFGYGTNKGGILQIVDREKLLIGPREPTPENLAFPEIGRLEMSPLVGAHTAVPLGDMRIAEFAKDKQGSTRNIVMIVDESLVNECQAAEARQMVFFVDATIERRPMVVSNFYVPEASGNFCTRGGRFGAHSVEREHGARLLSEGHLHHLLQCRRARGRHPQSVLSRRRSPISSRRSPKRPTSAASRSTARIAARSRSRATTWRPTIAAISTWPIAPIPGCTFSSSPARRGSLWGCLR